MKKNEIKIGDIFLLLGHQLKVKKISSGGWGENQHTLACQPHCCTIPYGIKMICTEEDLISLQEKKN